jgi:hypothetical protein
MSSNQYTVINKCFDNINLIGFTIQSEEGTKKLIKPEDVVKLARGNRLTNAEFMLDTTSGEYIARIENGVTNLPTIYKNSDLKLTLICRLIDSSGKCIGYKARDNTGKAYKLSINKTWELACNNNIEGVAGRIACDKKILVSDNEHSLKELPKLNN